MSLNYVTITGTFDDGALGALTGVAVFAPSQLVSAAGVPVVQPANPSARRSSTAG